MGSCHQIRMPGEWSSRIETTGGITLKKIIATAAIATFALLAGKAFTADDDPTDKPAKETVDSNQTDTEKAKEKKPETPKAVSPTNNVEVEDLN